jgi:exopolysaccharide production protein ExoY
MNGRHSQVSVLETGCHAAGLPFWKRFLDLTCILLSAPVWLPAMLVIGVFIRLTSAGPALFRQERVGYLGRPFTCFKFRTMIVNADTAIHEGHLRYLMETNVPMRKLDVAGDPRLIPGGRILRALGLDELPQLFNVLRGEMSLVGPRPCLPYEYERFTPYHRQRFEAVPGITGLWQVSGKNRTTFDQMIELDIQYARNKTLLTDIRILFKTIPAIISQSSDRPETDSKAVSRPAVVHRT